MGVFRVRNAQILLHPGVPELFWDGLQYSILGLGPKEAVFQDLAAAIEDPKMGVFVGFDLANTPAAMGIIALPVTSLLPTPQVLALYCPDNHALKRKIVRAGVEFMRANGYMKFWAINGSGHPDPVWARAFREVAEETGKLASLYEFEIGDE